jgi:predicted GH43/DUF377 family glycosyl hydrolase
MDIIAILKRWLGFGQPKKSGDSAKNRKFFSKGEKNPIISPNSRNGWEAWQTFNPGVILLDDKVHFLYRAIGQDGLSRLGYASSDDGFKINERLPIPIYEHKITRRTLSPVSCASGGSWGGCEDPRIVRVDDEDTLYMTYTACDGGLRVALTSIKLEDFLNKRWKWEHPALISAPGEVHKNWVIFPEKINGKYAILHSISPEILIDYVDSLDFDGTSYISSCYDAGERTNCWDNWVRGPGPPPIKTKDGWLLFYHAMDDSDPGKYKVGAMLLDNNDPTKVLYRSKEPVLEPCESYENQGFKPGVVYVTGAVVKNGELIIYYGGADSFVCSAHNKLDDFLKELKKKEMSKIRGFSGIKIKKHKNNSDKNKAF